MLIKFNDHDPRAGTVARMDSTRGQQLVDAGAAVRVAENGAPIDAAPAVTTRSSRKPAASRATRNPPKQKAPAKLEPGDDAGQGTAGGQQAQQVDSSPAHPPADGTDAANGTDVGADTTSSGKA